jgi:hypothetical protein
MSALGQKRTLGRLYTMSALPPKADIAERDWDVRFVPKAEVAVIRSVDLIVQPGAKDAVGEMGVSGSWSPGQRGNKEGRKRHPK